MNTKNASYQYHKWNDITLTTIKAAITFVRDLVVFVRDYDKYESALPSITEHPCQCDSCDWVGVVGDCGSGYMGNLTCPECLTVIEVTVGN